MGPALWPGCEGKVYRFIGLLVYWQTDWNHCGTVRPPRVPRGAPQPVRQIGPVETKTGCDQAPAGSFFLLRVGFEKGCDEKSEYRVEKQVAKSMANNKHLNIIIIANIIIIMIKKSS